MLIRVCIELLGGVHISLHVHVCVPYFFSFLVHLLESFALALNFVFVSSFFLFKKNIVTQHNYIYTVVFYIVN